MMAGKLQGVGGGQRHGCVQSAGGVLLLVWSFWVSSGGGVGYRVRTLDKSKRICSDINCV